jgi:hypothetical protein
MKTTTVIMLVLKAALAATVLFLSTTILFAQEKMEKLEKQAHKTEKMNREFCSNENWSNGDKVGFRELREMTLPASGSLAVDGGKNGGIKVKGSNLGTYRRSRSRSRKRYQDLDRRHRESGRSE